MKSHARPDLDAPDLIELLELDGSAVQGPLLPERRCCARSAAACCGTSVWRWETWATEPALTRWQRATADAEPLIAEHARWAIERIELRNKSRPA